MPEVPLSSLDAPPLHAKSKTRSLCTALFGRDKKYVVQTKTKRTITKWQVFNIVRRLLVIVAAILYIYTSIVASWRIMEVLRDMTTPPSLSEVLLHPLSAATWGMVQSETAHWCKAF